MELQSARMDELRELARQFRARAAGCPRGHFHDLILQSARELEELANSLAAKDGAKDAAHDEDETINL